MRFTRRNKRRANSYRKWLRERLPAFEQLEAREMLTVNWRNPVDALDINADGVTVPLDVLTIVNKLNATGAGELPAVKDPDQPFLDANGDQFLSPLDPLQVINGLNAGNFSPFRLNEGSALAREATATITLGQATGTRTYRLQIDATFDTPQSGPGDVLGVYVVDPSNHSETLLDRGTLGTALFTLAGDRAEFVPGLVRWDGSVLELDLSGLPNLDTGVIKLQLLSLDDESGTRITVLPLTNEVDLEGSLPLTLPPASPSAEPGGSMNLNGLVAQTSIAADFENVRFDKTTGRLAAEVQLSNDGAAIGRSVAMAFPGLPPGVTLQNAAGTTSDGTPFINLQPVISAGGLPAGGRSERMLVEFDDPGNTRFVLAPEVLAAENRAPTLVPIEPLNVFPGGVVSVALSATDPDGDPITFSFADTNNLPTGTLQGDGVLVFQPEPNELGTHQFTVVASDGVLEAKQPVTLNVVADPITTTRVSGFIKDVDKTPLAGMQVEIGAVQALTNPDGSFLIDLGSGPIVADTLKVRGEKFPGPLVYPFIAEKLPLVLEHAIFAGVNNVITRPIYLPPLDVASGKAIDPAVDTTVTTAAIPGASVVVKAGTLMNQQGTPFTGVLSITEVPVNLTPAALPDNLFPSLVVTIQPGEMVFAAPAPLSLPNVGQLPPGTLMDLWSINPVTGDFDNVGTGQVSSNGSKIDTISGGIRNSSWHLFVQPVNTIGTPQDPNGNQRNQDLTGVCRTCPPPKQHIKLTATVETGSQVELHSGALFEEHPLVTYQSLGEERGFQLNYNSLRADPRPILHFSLDNTNGFAVGTTVDLALGRLSFTHEGVTEQLAGFEVPPDNFGLLPVGSHFWQLPPGRNDLDLALQASLRNKPSGVYRFDLNFGIQRFTGLTAQTGALQTFSRNETIVNKRFSAFGAGWDLADLQEIIENEDGSILLITGGGGETIYDPPATAGGPFVSRPGDFGVMEKLPDGNYRYTDKFATVTQFIKLPSGSHQVGSITDRNGNRTNYEYESGGNISRIVDPVGLATTFAINTVGKVTSITDPAGRVTQLIHVGENLVEIRDPDGTSRKFEYDSERRMTAEIDKRGFREEEVYGFHGRIIQTIDKEGRVRNFEPVQTVGLFPFERTTNRNNPPTATIVLQNVAESQHTEPNGNVIITTMDQAGLEIAKRDSVGALPTQERNADGQPTRVTDARGNVTQFTYDENGNVIIVVDEIARELESNNTLFPAPMYRFDAVTMNRVALGDLNGDGALDMVVTLGQGTNNGIFPFDRNHVGIRLNNGDGTFGNAVEVDVGGASARDPFVVRLADLNDDNTLDILTTNRTSETVSVLLGNGDGTFGPPRTFTVGAAQFAIDLTVADFNGDGNLDFAAGSDNFGVHVLLGDGTGNFTPRTTIAGINQVRELVAADFTGDGVPDLATASIRDVFSGGDRLRVFVNDGTGLFGAAVFVSASALDNPNIAAADLDGDGDTDLVGADDRGFIHVFLNNGTGQFTETFTRIAPAWNDLELDDLDQDGKLDIVTVRSDSTIFILPGNGNGTFGSIVQQLVADFPEGLAIGDVDGNGVPDAVTTHGRNGAVTVVQGQRGRFFYTNSYTPSGPNPAHIVLADMNNDGAADVVSANDGSSTQAISVALNNGSGKLGQPFHQALSREGRALAVGDLNADGNLDVATVSSIDGQRHISLGNGDGTLNPATTTLLPGGTINNRGMDVAMADLNGDGKLDLVVQQIGGVSIFLGNGDGTFPDPVFVSFSSQETVGGGVLAVTDIDGDDDLDILAPAFGNFRLLRNNGDGTFAAPVVVNVASATGKLSAGDVDGDGDNDVVVRVNGAADANVGELSQVALLKNLGNGTFDPAVLINLGYEDSFSAAAIRLADMNLDGKLDLVSQPQVNNGPSTAVIHFGNGDGTFQGPQQFALANGQNQGRGGLGIGDLNGDGFLDLVGSTGVDYVPALNQTPNLGRRSGPGAKLFSYDPTFNVLTSSRDEAGHTAILEVDPTNGNTSKHIAVIGQLGGGDDLETSFTYNSRGQILTSTDPLGRITEHTYNNRGHLIQATRAKGTADEAITRFEYDEAGNNTAEIDPLGNRTELTYDALNRVTKVKDALGFETTYAYDAAGNPVAATDARSNTARIAYDRLNRATQVTDALGSITRYGYDANGNIITEIDPLRRTARFAYDVRDRLTTSTDPAGGRVVNRYDADNNLIRTTDQLGAVTQFAYDARNRKVSATNALLQTEQFVYDAADQLRIQVDRLGRRTQFDYDDAQRLTATTDALNGVRRNEYDRAGNVVGQFDELNRATVFAFDNLDRQVRVTDALGGVFESTYDAASNRLTQRDPLGRVTATDYDALNRRETVTDALGGVTRYAYDEVGNVASVTDPRGNLRSYAYDVRNLLTAATDELGGVLKTEYDVAGQITAVVDELDRRTTFAYDLLGNRVLVTNARGDSTAFTFDARSQLISSTDALGRVSRLEYDLLGRATVDTDALGNTVRTQYDAVDNTIAITDRRGNTTRFEYDALDRTTQRTDALGGVARTTYNAVGEQTLFTDELGRTTGFVYDVLGRVVQQTDPANQTTITTYDAVGNQLSVTDPLNRTTQYTYDALDRRITRTDALGGVSRHEYDPNGNTTKRIDERGNETRYTHDARNLLIQQTDALGGVLASTYDAARQVTSITDPLGNTTRLFYDAVRNLIRTVDAEGNETRTEYDAVRNHTRGIDALGHATNTQYDALNRIIRTTDALGNATQLSYDPNGNPTTATDRRGNTTQFTYDALNRLRTATDAIGGVQRSTYDAAGQLTQSQNAIGDTTAYEYDVRGNIVKITDAEGHQTVSAYDAVSNRTQITDALGFTSQTEFDALDRPVAFVDALGKRSTSGYDAVGNPTLIVDPNGNRTTTTYDALNRVATITDAQGGVVQHAYDAASRRIGRTNQLGGTQTFTFDAVGNLESFTDENSNTSTSTYDAVYNLTASTDAEGFTTQYEYDALRREVRRIDARGKATVSVHDAEGNLVSRTDPLGRVTQTEYDALDRPVRFIDALGGVVQQTYDGIGRLLTATDQLGRTTRFVYNVFNQPTQVTDALNQVAVNAYDAVGNHTSSTDPLGRTTNNAYDGNRRLTRTTDALNRATLRGYDDNGNVTTVTDPLGGVATTTFDALNRMVRINDALGNQTTRTYDALGRLLTRTDALGAEFSFTYDPVGNVLTQTDALGHVTRSAYNDVNSLVQITDALGQVSRKEYDELQRLTRDIDARGFATLYNYDDASNVIRITDASDNATAYTYDALDRKVSETNALGDTRTFSFDAVSNLTSETDRLGRRTEYAYDALNRPTAENWFDSGNANAVNSIARTYDAAGQLISLADVNASYAYTYSVAGERLSVSNAGTAGVPAVVLEYVYDARSSVTQMTEKVNAVTGAVMNYLHDAIGRTTRMTQTGTGVSAKRVDLGYDAIGQLTSLDRFSDSAGTVGVAQSDSTYDLGGRITSLRHDRGATPINQFTNTFDDLSRVTQQTSTDGTSNYTYDPTSQLTAADNSFQADESFSYDATGNRTNDGNTVGANNRQLSDGTFNFEYDDEGNRVLRTEIATGTVTEYSYDHRNRLTGITVRDNGGTVRMQATYTYDALNRRIGKTVDPDGAGAAPATTTRYVHNDDQILLTFDGDGNQSRRVLSGAVVDQVFAEETDDGTFWSLPDQIGSVRDVVDNTGVAANHLTYSSFGSVTAQTDPGLDNLFTFTGRELDAESGLYYFRNRYYDSVTGRFLSEDPTGFEGGDLNLNRYVGNNPTNQTDPLGLAPLNTVNIFNDPELQAQAGGLIQDRLDLADVMKAAGAPDDFIQESLSEIDFFISRGRFSDARSILNHLLQMRNAPKQQQVTNRSVGNSTGATQVQTTSGQTSTPRRVVSLSNLANPVGAPFDSQGVFGGQGGGNVGGFNVGGGNLGGGGGPGGVIQVVEVERDERTPEQRKQAELDQLKRDVEAAALREKQTRDQAEKDSKKTLEQLANLEKHHRAEFEKLNKASRDFQNALQEEAAKANAPVNFFTNANGIPAAHPVLNLFALIESQLPGFFDSPTLRGLYNNEGIVREGPLARRDRLKAEGRGPVTFGDFINDFAGPIIPGYTTLRKTLFPCNDRVTIEDVGFDALGFYGAYRTVKNISSPNQGLGRLERSRYRQQLPKKFQQLLDPLELQAQKIQKIIQDREALANDIRLDQKKVDLAEDFFDNRLEEAKQKAKALGAGDDFNAEMQKLADEVEARRNSPKPETETDINPNETATDLNPKPKPQPRQTELGPVLDDVDNPAEYIRDRLGPEGENAAQAYELAKKELGDQAQGIGGSFANPEKTPRTFQYPEGTTFAQAQYLDKAYELTKIMGKEIMEVPTFAAGAKQIGAETLAEALQKTGRPSDLDLITSATDADALRSLGERIFNQTGVLIEFVDKTGKSPLGR